MLLGFQLLARELWHRRKHGYARRAVRRLLSRTYKLVGNSVVSNTSGRAMTPGAAPTSGVCLPT